jgi:hypothetical protein
MAMKFKLAINRLCGFKAYFSLSAASSIEHSKQIASAAFFEKSAGKLAVIANLLSGQLMFKSGNSATWCFVFHA